VRGDKGRDSAMAEMRLGIIADTHVGIIDDVPLSVRKALSHVDLFVHAGDFIGKEVLDGLSAIGQVKAVCGNMDSAELKADLPEREEFEINGRRIGLIHGSGSLKGIAERVKNEFSGVDIIIFGHSHQPCNQYIEGVLLFNPGEARNSFGLLTIGDQVKAHILKS